MSHLGIETTSTFDGDPAPKDGTYTFYLVSEKVEGYFSVDAVTGIATELTEADMQVQEGVNDETFPQDEEDIFTDDSITEDDVASLDETSSTVPETVEDTKSAEETTSEQADEVTAATEA